MPRIIGLLFSGAAVRLFSIGAALYVGHLGYVTLTHSLNAVNHALTVLP
jgi:hypothetical protein